MRKTQAKVMVSMPLRLILLLVIAVVVLHGYSAAAQVVGTSNPRAAIGQVTILDPFELIAVTVTMTETVVDDDSNTWNYRHRFPRSTYKPPL